MCVCVHVHAYMCACMCVMALSSEFDPYVDLLSCLYPFPFAIRHC